MFHQWVQSFGCLLILPQPVGHHSSQGGPPLGHWVCACREPGGRVVLPETLPHCSCYGAGAEQGIAGQGPGGSPVVVVMLELMEKLQAGAPAASQQLVSSCRYPRASENSL